MVIHMKPIRFKFSAQKAKAAILLIAQQRPGIDIHALLKACYFADVAHLNAHGRPIFGATYRAMKFGPVPLEIYEMVKGDAIWLAELSLEGFPWRLDGFRVQATANEAVDTDAFSESDLEALQAGIARSLSMTFNERTEATHGPDWQAKAKARLPLGRLVTAAEAARLAVYLLSDASIPQTGTIIDLEQKVTGAP